MSTRLVTSRMPGGIRRRGRFGAASPPQFVDNPGFETWPDPGTQTPPGWEDGSAGSSDVTREDIITKSGGRAAKFSTDASGNVAAISQVVALEAVAQRIEYFYRTDATQKAAISIQQEFGTGLYLQADGTWAAAQVFHEAPLSDGVFARWTETFTPAEAGDHRIEFRTNVVAASTVFYLDDIRIFDAVLSLTVSGLLETDDFERPNSDAPGGNWTEMVGDVDIVSNEMEMNGISFSAAVARNNAVAARTKSFFQVRARWWDANNPPLLAAYSNEAFADRDGYEAWIDDLNGLLKLRKATNGASVVLASSAASWLARTNYMMQFFSASGRQEAAVEDENGVLTLDAADSDHDAIAKVGWVWRAGGGASANEVWWDDYQWLADKVLTVSGLPAGAKVQVRDPQDTLIAEATEAGGTATVDLSRFAGVSAWVPWAGWRTIEVRDSADALIDNISEDGVHPGNDYDHAA